MEISFTNPGNGFVVHVTVEFPGRPEDYEGEFDAYMNTFMHWLDHNFACFGYKGEHVQRTSNDYI